MLSKNEVKYIQNLYHKKTRDAEKLFVAEGVKIVEELLATDFEIKKIYTLADWKAPIAPKAEIITVTPDELERISGLQTPNKVLAVVAQKNNNDEPKINGQLSLVLDAIRDPGNMGTIVRIADWFGIKNIIASNDCVEIYNPKVIQSTMGSFARVDVVYKNLSEWLPQQTINIYGAMLDGTDVHALENINEGLLIIGNEGKGISEELQKCITQKITIPRYGNAESLNAAVATGIILSHILK